MRRSTQRCLSALLSVFMLLSLFIPVGAVTMTGEEQLEPDPVLEDVGTMPAAQVSAAAPQTWTWANQGTFFQVTGDRKGREMTYNGTTYTEGLKLQGSASITFTAPSGEAGVLTMVFANTSTDSNKSYFLLDGANVTMEPQKNSMQVYTNSTLTPGQHTIQPGEKEATVYYLEWAVAHTHQWDAGQVDKEPTCTEAGAKTFHCTAADCPSPTKTEELPAKGHTPKTVAKVDATCVKDGKQAEVVCSVCNEHISGGEVIKATGEHTRDAATGKCTVCGATVAAEHTCVWSATGTVTKAPTCTEKGKQTVKCTVQDCDKTKEVDVPALGHDLEHHAAVAPVCGKNGHSAYDTCKRCDYTTFKAAAHTDANGDGICDVCNDEIAKALTGAGGWFETLYVETNQFEPKDVTAVSWTGASNGKLDRDGLTFLVRAGLNGGKTRIDVPGVKAGTYTVTVTAGGVNYQAANVEAMAYDRSGFAHFNYTKGVGAYRDDGVLKDDAIILYVNDQNKDTVTVTSADGTTVTGIGHILNSVGQDSGGGLNSKGGLANNNKGILKKLADDKTPLVVRIIDDVTLPDGLTAFNSADYGGTKGDNGAMARMSAASNVTIEGIGPNASTNGWGFHFIRNTSDVGTDRGTSVEFRNLAFRNVPEDCIGMEGQQSGTTLTAPVERCWVHNCSFYVPNILNPAESDKRQGDGACDFKRGQYMTMSYCHFDGYHKTNLVGSSDSSLQYHITWHHNYWQNCASRGPLGRQANMHIYNNIYENQISYAMNPRANCYIFSEFNVFDRVKNPMQIKQGAIKSYKDVFSGVSGDEDGTVVTNKNQVVDSANKYKSFELDSTLSYIPSGDYKLDTITGARQNILAYAGPMKAQIIKAEDVDTEVVDKAQVPQNAVVLPYDQDLNKAYIATSGEKDNIAFDLVGADTGLLKIGKTGQSILFKVAEPVDISIEDGGGTGKAALYNASGENLLIGTGSAENLPAGVYFIQSSMVDPSKGTYKEAKIAHLTITKAASATPPHVHSFTNYVQTVAPTCTKEGTKLATCACGDATDRQAIPMIPHDFSTGVCPTCGALASVLGEVDPNAPTVDVTGVTLDAESPVTLLQGGNQALSATILPANATDKSLEWTSSDESVATVSRKGVVAAIGPGVATITVTAAGGKSDSVEVQVLAVTTQTHTFNPKTEGPAEIKTSNGETEVTSWTNTFFSQKGSNKWKAPGYNASKKDYSTGALLLGTGESGSLDFTVTAPTTIRTLTLTVSSTSSKNTSAVALKNSAGEYILSAADKTFNAVSGTAAFTVTYTDLPAGTYSIMAPKGVTVADVDPDSELTDFASNETNPNGRGVWIRSASVVTAQVVDGEYVPVTGVTLDPATLSLEVGQTATLTPVVTPDNASNKVPAWSTDNAAVASVASGVVTARSAGTATITAKVGGQTATCTVTVAAAVGGATPVSAIKVTDLAGQTSGAVQADDADDVTVQLTADVDPDNATDPSVTWSVTPADKGVVVNSLGKVTVSSTAQTATVTVTAAAQDGSGVKGSYTLSVTAAPNAEPDDQPSAPPSDQPSAPPSDQPSAQPSETPGAVAVAGVSLNKKSATLKVGGTVTLKATVTPANAANKGVYWTSSDTSVVTVDQTGKVTGVKAGLASILATTLDGGKMATCTVEVTAASIGGGGGGSPTSAKPTTPPDASSNTPAATLPFLDVAVTAWFHDSVKRAFDLGLMRGTDATHFAPNATTTRAMVATVLFRLDGEKKTDVKDLFEDVASGQWYTDAVAWANAKGVVKGYDTDTFAPEDSVTREQLAVMLYRYAKAAKTDRDLSAFADAASVSDWAAEAVAWAVDQGIITGKGNGILDPQGLASRAEICTMLVRFLDLKK